MPRVMPLLAAMAYRELLRFEVFVVRKDFAGLYARVRRCPVEEHSPGGKSVAEICTAVEFACLWYWRDVFCLQRSAAAVCLLKHFGVSAQLVIGAQLTPFKAHAWVEVEGQVVNDRTYVTELYAVLDRC